MKLNKYHKKVLSVALDIFENNGDDSWMDVEHDPKLKRAYDQLNKVANSLYKPIKIKHIDPKRDPVKMGNLTHENIIAKYKNDKAYRAAWLKDFVSSKLDNKKRRSYDH
jgi:hypothetical protein